jgi:hypothetical protein
LIVRVFRPFAVFFLTLISDGVGSRPKDSGGLVILDEGMAFFGTFFLPCIVGIVLAIA